MSVSGNNVLGLLKMIGCVHVYYAQKNICSDFLLWRSNVLVTGDLGSNLDSNSDQLSRVVLCHDIFMYNIGDKMTSILLLFSY